MKKPYEASDRLPFHSHVRSAAQDVRSTHMRLAGALR